MRFEFATATRIIFGPGTIGEVPSSAAGFGQRAFLVTGQNQARAAPLLERLDEQGIEVAIYPIAGEPTTAVALEGVQQAREMGAQVVIGMGDTA